MTEALAPDHALQGWRDQIEENARLRQQIEDQRSKIEDLGRLNHDVLFEAQRYKSLAEIAGLDATYQKHVSDHRGAALDALAGVATDLARHLTSFAGRCFDAARAEPPTPTVTAASSHAEPASPLAPSAKPQAETLSSHERPTDIPVFLAPALHVTRLPEVRP